MNTADRSDRCLTFRYFAPNPDGISQPGRDDGSGECRRKAPVCMVYPTELRTTLPVFVARWPQVRPLEWCGEWGPIPLVQVTTPRVPTCRPQPSPPAG